MTFITRIYKNSLGEISRDKYVSYNGYETRVKCKNCGGRLEVLRSKDMEPSPWYMGCYHFMYKLRCENCSSYSIQAEDPNEVKGERVFTEEQIEKWSTRMEVRNDVIIEN